jgi:uncharacterized membrane protein
MSALLMGLVIFLGVHSIGIVAPTLRLTLIDRWGLARWRGLFSGLSLIGFALLVYGFAVARQSLPILWTPPQWLKWVALGLLLPVFPMLLASALPGRIKRSLKHPMLAAIKTWALAHLLANGGLADLILFGSFLLWAVADRIATKHRTPPPRPAAPERARNDVLAVVGGGLLYLVMLLGLHQWLIGVSPLP